MTELICKYIDKKDTRFQLNDFFIGKSYKCEIRNLITLIYIENCDHFFYSFFNAEINNYFYTQQELRKLKLKKINGSTSTM
jgi:hypothetical protein